MAPPGTPNADAQGRRSRPTLNAVAQRRRSTPTLNADPNADASERRRCPKRPPGTGPKGREGRCSSEKNNRASYAPALRRLPKFFLEVCFFSPGRSFYEAPVSKPSLALKRAANPSYKTTLLNVPALNRGQNPSLQKRLSTQPARVEPRAKPFPAKTTLDPTSPHRAARTTNPLHSRRSR